MILYLNSLKKMGGGVNDSGIVYKTKIYLNKNFIIDKLLVITDECNINVNDNYVLKIDNNGKLTIGFNVGDNCALNIIKGGVLNINGGTLRINSGSFLSIYGTLTIDDGKLTNYSNGYINNNGNLNINGGTLSFEAFSTLNNNGNLNIKGGTLSFEVHSALNNNDGNILFTKGSINAAKDLEMYMVDKNFQERTILKTYDSVLSSFGVSNPSVNSSSEYNEALFEQFKDLLDSELSDIDKSNTIWPKQAITGEITGLREEILKLNDEIERLKNNQEDNEDIDLNNLKEKINLLDNNLSSIDTKIQKLILFSLINVKNI